MVADPQGDDLTAALKTFGKNNFHSGKRATHARTRKIYTQTISSCVVVSDMRSVAWLAQCFFACALAGCSIHPLPDNVTPYSTADIAEKIRCEARDAIRRHVRQGDATVENGGIGYNFSFTITENNNVGAGSKFTLPFSNGRFILDLGVGEDKQRQSERKFFIADAFSTFGKKDGFRDLRGRPVHCPADGKVNWRYPITGNIGLDEVVKTFVELGAPAKFSDVLVFTTKFSGSVSPKVELSAVRDVFRLTELSGSMKADRQDIHKVTIILAGGQTPQAGFAPDDIVKRLQDEAVILESLDNQSRILDELRRR